MSEEQPSVGERRRRREAERAAQTAADAERPLTRRELRAREEALRSGAIELDQTGELRVIRQPPLAPPAEPDPLDMPATGTIGLTRRQLRELREQQAAAAVEPSPSGPEAEAASPSARQSPAAPPRRSPTAPTAPPASSPVTAAPGPTPAPGPSPTPAPASPAAPPAIPATTQTSRPPVRRPVVRAPSAAVGVRNLAGDGTGLMPVQRTSAADLASPTAWAPDEAPSIDVSAVVSASAAPPVAPPPIAPTRPATVEPVIVPDPGPLPTTRRTRRVAAEEMLHESIPPSIDAVITGDAEEPEPFTARPSWAELPPPTPSTPMAAVGPDRAGPSSPEQPSFAQVIAPAVADEAEQDDDEDDDEEEHRTPRWLTALMFLVLIVIGIVLGLLVLRLVTGDDAAAAASWDLAMVSSQGGAA